MYFYDTCSLLNNLGLIQKMNQRFIISSITIQELENIKTASYKDDEIKYKARRVVDWLKNADFMVWRYLNGYDDILKEHHLEINNDTKICACAYVAHISYDIFFVTEDILCQQFAKILQVPIINLSKDKEKYYGWIDANLSEDELAFFYATQLNEFNGTIQGYHMLPNQYLILTQDNKTIDEYKWTGDKLIKVPYFQLKTNLLGTIKPMADDGYQRCALDSLLCNKLTVLRGHAGSGKSYLALGYLCYALEKGIIDKIIIFCNPVAVRGAAKLGYYPGTRDSKLLDSQIGNFLSAKFGDKLIVEDLMNKNQLLLLPMADVRGFDTTGMKAGIYITEAQNMTIDMMKLALQRIGDDCICILDGDSDTQVDVPIYSGINNGLDRVSEVFRGQDFYGEIELQYIHRSKIAELAEQM